MFFVYCWLLGAIVFIVPNSQCTTIIPDDLYLMYSQSVCDTTHYGTSFEDVMEIQTLER